MLTEKLIRDRPSRCDSATAKTLSVESTNKYLDTNSELGDTELAGGTPERGVVHA